MHSACTLFALLSVLPLGEMAVPGTFFWKPRVRLDINKPKTDKSMCHDRTLQNIQNGLVVIIDGYELGLTVVALSSYLVDVRPTYPHLHPGMGPYYTNVYRWALRYLSLLPEWLEGRNKNYVTTHKVWKKRFFYMDKFVPKWMRKLLFFVDEKTWEYEDWEYANFKKHAQPHFGKYYRYPSKRFNNFNSMHQEVTVENMDVSNDSITIEG